MGKKLFWISLVAIIISFIGGFLLANAFNRREMEELRAEIGRLKTAPPAADEENSKSVLSDDEIRQKIAEADKNSGDIEFQKNLAIALYRYATMKQDSKWLPEIAKLLNRVVEKNPKDYNTLVSLGDIYFDLAQNIKDAPDSKAEQNKGFLQSREFYRRALVMNPNDAQLLTDYGSTFLFAEPPENEKAIAGFQKSLQINPKSEKTLEFLTRAFINSGKTDEAKKYFDKLKEINPQSNALPDLEKQLTQTGKN